MNFRKKIFQNQTIEKSNSKKNIKKINLKKNFLPF